MTNLFVHECDWCKRRVETQLGPSLAALGVSARNPERWELVENLDPNFKSLLCPDCVGLRARHLRNAVREARADDVLCTQPPQTGKKGDS